MRALESRKFGDETSRGVEPEAEAVGGRPQPGQEDAPGCLVKKILRPALRRAPVKEYQVGYGVSQRRVCAVFGFPRLTDRYESTRDERAQLRIRLRDLARSRPHNGYQRLYVLLRREGWLVNHKLVYRLYCEEGLGIQRKRPRRAKNCQVRQTRSPSVGPNDSWRMDFLSDQLFSGKRFRVLTLVDNFSRESLAIRAGQRLTGDDVVQTVDAVVKSRGAKPTSLCLDNSPEFISKSLDLWAYWNGVKLDFSRPGKPTDNALIESFNGKFRAECLNEHWFMSLDEA